VSVHASDKLVAPSVGQIFERVCHQVELNDFEFTAHGNWIPLVVASAPSRRSA
jgi:hypothetical protein